MTALDKQSRENILKRLRFEESISAALNDISFLETWQLWVASMWHHHDWDSKTFPTLKDDFIMTTGLCGEAGEAADCFKKLIRDDVQPGTERYNELRQKLLLELGDVFYELTIIAYRWGIHMDEIVKGNVNKLEERFADKISKLPEKSAK